MLFTVWWVSAYATCCIVSEYMRTYATYFMVGEYVCYISVRNNGRTLDIIRPFWPFVRSKNAGVGHLAEHN